MLKMDLEKQKIAKKVVEFWLMIEFLSQDSFPRTSKVQIKNVKLAIRMAKGLSLPKGCFAPKKITIFEQIKPNNIFSEIVKHQNKIYSKHRYLSDTIHICYGQIEKETIVQNLYTSLSIIDDRPELEKGRLCIFALKINNEGYYIENSLRISPMLWGLHKCISAPKVRNHGISSQNYYDDVKEFESLIDMEKEVTTTVLQSIYASITQKYIRKLNINREQYSNNSIFTYSRYDSEKLQKKDSETTNDVSELLNGFYIDDLKMISESISEAHDKNSMHSDIIDYVSKLLISNKYPTQNLEDKDRIDLRTCDQTIRDILSVNNSPIAKWPSRFSSVLMQQIAVNFTRFEDIKQSRIFSVNGPPGTGKTTLLKEIIARNVVERAKLLSNFDRPDAAFIKHSYNDGNCKFKGYDDFYPSYYSFKDKSLSEFSILVASNNNAAVENISKDLPNLDSLISNLVSKSVSSENDANLNEVASLFNVHETQETENFFLKLSKDNEGNIQRDEIEKNDVYFSWNAHKLLTGDQSIESAISTWGLISSPMGKSSNVSKYYFFAIKNILDSFYNKNIKIENRIHKYDNARKAFLSQLSLVESLQMKLIEDSKAESKYLKLVENFNHRITSLEKEIEKNKSIIDNINLSIQKSKWDLAEREREYYTSSRNIENQNDIISNTSALISGYENEIFDVQNSIISNEDSRKLYEILLHKWIKTERLNRIKSLKEFKFELESKSNLCKIELDEQNEILYEMSKINEQVIADLKQIKLELSKLEEKIKSHHEKIEEYYSEISKLETSKAESKLKFERTTEKLKEDREIINNNFIEKYLSKNTNDNLGVQLSNPWMTEKYNREREKLFYYAMKLHKEFILASKCCRSNFVNLGLLWKYRESSKKELANFSNRDKDIAFPNLLDTLFLLTPVISTTFASVGRFLRHCKKKESLGLLIVDEAGQASPQIALGALWRSKKAIIVGDPKQVEPVVTDEANAIKRAFSDEDILPYMDKTLSVQGFADSINKYGSYISNPLEDNSAKEWVGCPLVVHRRCIEPMFSISNAISYGGTMKYQTSDPKESVARKFIRKNSCWIDIVGREVGNKNHYVPEQGKRTVELITKSFKLYDGYPDLYVISPFKSVIEELAKTVRNTTQLVEEYGDDVERWIENCCGTVHKFQGKEANEVIFLLGCDEKAMGAIRWVKPNILNVAVTRAKYRLYIIGDSDIWRKSAIFNTAYDFIKN